MDGLSGSARGRIGLVEGVAGERASPSSRALQTRIGSAIFFSVRDHIVERYIDLGSDLTLGVIRNAYPSRLGNALKTGSNVNAVAENVVVIENDVSDVDANTK